jgi:hypothetical protein
VSEQERVARGSQIIDGYGDDNTFDRLQGWDDNLSADARKEIDDEFITDVWRILDSAGNLLIRKHHDYGPKTSLTVQVDHSTDSACECGTRLRESIISSIQKLVLPTNRLETPS